MTYDTMQDTSTGVPPAPGRSPSGDGDARDAARDAAHHAADQGRAVMGEAADHARDLGDEARRQLDTVAGEARDQARRALSDTTDELNAQIEQRMSDATSLARTRAGELRALAEGRPEDAGPLPDMARRASDRLGHTADRVDELGVRGVIDEVSEFARRRPLLFLAGAAGAGLLVGRLARATRELDGSPGNGQEALATAPTTPLGTPRPQSGPAGVSPALGADPTSTADLPGPAGGQVPAPAPPPPPPPPGPTGRGPAGGRI